MNRNLILKISLAIFLFSNSLAGYAQQLISFRGTDKKYGFKDSLNTVVIEPRFDYVNDFYEGLSIVMLDHKYGCIDSKGAEVFSCKYDESLGRYSEGLAGVKLNGNWGYVDKTGTEVIPFKFSHVDNFKNDLAEVSEFPHKYFIDKTGRKLFSTDDYMTFGPFKCGFVMVGKEKRFGCLDKTGREVIPTQYEDVLIREADVIAVKQNGTWGAVDGKNYLFIPMIYGNALIFEDGMAAVKLNGKWGFIDKENKTIIPFIYDKWISSFKNNIALMEVGGEKIEIDKTGKRVNKVTQAYKKEVAKKNDAGGNKSPAKISAIKIPLSDTAFHTFGVKFGFPTGYKVFTPPRNPNYLEFGNTDSSILITVYNTGNELDGISENWDSASKIPGVDGWFKHIGKVAKKVYNIGKPVFTSDYFYPNTFGGAQYIWIRMETTKAGEGIPQFEAIKASVGLRPQPLVYQEVVQGYFSMGVPAYLVQDEGFRLDGSTAFRSQYSSLYPSKNEEESSLLSWSHAKKRCLMSDVKDIHYYSSSGISFYGYYGANIKDGHYEAHVFFDNPKLRKEECGEIILKYRQGIPLNMENDMKVFLETVKFN